ncbi:MarP family serine protease [Microbacterium sp. zg.Y1090]|uniref:MarP family serine protease n=1 Tax=Microbacterium wangruii TaxID=3049073 RepID=UPI00214B40FC|nr:MULTISPECIES: MarP family serine protease [unclassified Microbacterium]MCR2818458.1 MarP family serine protease [Microbacterium sp. zg.Y1090]MDL5486271.1 MarP family serine protease [Microbacterium sp. zg-Y1211]WIM29468.1 MarP family serine protease [Microbacterium sp. zg-Y1090]
MIIDVVVVVVLVVALLLGVRSGLLAGLGALVGVVVGALAAYWLMPLVLPAVSDVLPAPGWRTAIVIAGTLVLIALAAGLGAGIGAMARRGVDRIRLGWLERLLGGGLSVLVAALAVSLVAQTVGTSGIPLLSAAVSSSQAVRTIDALTPAPVDAALAQVRGAFLEEGLPRLGDLFGPGVVLDPGQQAPQLALDDPDLDAAAQSIARISGVAYACGTSSTGTGFVAADDRIITNAHVVAGVTDPVVEFPGGAVRDGRIVYFDAVDDLAVIAVDDIDVAPLAIAAPLATGDEGVVQGYPYGGPFTSGGARVLSVGVVDVPDIYDSAATPRDIYALAADVRPGNSGGPLLTTGGEVAGVVFARAESGDQIGYAMTPAEFAPVVAAAPSLTQPVSSGSCAG